MLSMADMTTKNPRLAYILAGGESKRFGSPKARVAVRGELLINKIARELTSDGLVPTIVAQRVEDYADVSWRCIPDRVPQSGPLMGVETALEDCRSQDETWCWIVTCDMVGWNPVWQLHALHVLSQRSLATQVVILDVGFQPFPGLYSVTGLDAIQAVWSGGDRSIRGWHDRLGSSVLRLPLSPDDQARSFNTPEELARILGA
jgi:molybdenum cofactor guanylyltransferase